ncbi:MAG: AAA family ATPase, partial [Lentisphaeria bacterium]|nr:AAA family ATPase [Lentisphaeria bacterium]
MKIKKLVLTNFRNYQHESVEFFDNTNIVVGKNAQGKTNLIEPIYILSTFKSFRNSKLVDCIREGESQAIIEA